MAGAGVVRAGMGLATRLTWGALAGALALSCGGDDPSTPTSIVLNGMASEASRGADEDVSGSSSQAETTAAPELTTIECLVGRSPTRPDPAIPSRVEGTTESRVDECDAEGNLIEYAC
jgi:hypothetical protein